MLKPPVPKFHFNLFTRLKDIVEKQVPVKLKLIVFMANHFFHDSAVEVDSRCDTTLSAYSKYAFAVFDRNSTETIHFSPKH